ncbi:MAG TPA: hypothetical protein VE152_10460 [Acidimicrobiales bacterium]|nr:hypothetical protein [Acidimicrobiales bacterium]
MDARHVLLALAAHGAGWRRRLTQWAATSTLEVVWCHSADELRVRLASSRPHSAMLVDARLTAVDRDLLRTGRNAGCAVLVVCGDHARQDWCRMGAHAVLEPSFHPADLAPALRRWAPPIPLGRLSDPDQLASLVWPRPDVAGPPALTIGVCGPGGTGASLLAMAVAQALGSPEVAPVAGRRGRRCHPVVVRSTPEGTDPSEGVLLADLARRADQAALHQLQGPTLGITELVVAHGRGRPASAGADALTVAIPRRGYRLLPGLHRPTAWGSIRPHAFGETLACLRAAHRVVVCDLDGDLEGEDAGGSIEVEERNLMARSAVVAADAVLAVGHPGPGGTAALTWLFAGLTAAGTPPERVIPVCNRAPRCRTARERIGRDLLGSREAGEVHLAGLVFLPEEHLGRTIEALEPLPANLTAPLAAAVTDVVARHGRRRPMTPSRPVAPGTLGHRAARRPDRP